MSNVIKSFAYLPLNELKLLETMTPLQLMKAGLLQPEDALDQLSPEQQQELQEANTLKDQILQDAEAFADEQIQQAMEEVTELREAAQNDIAQWWQERRNEDEAHIQEARQQGYDEGYAQGMQEAAESLRMEYSDMLLEARSILEQAYTLKQQIIQESEPFLIELSTSIAEKIVGRQLTLQPEWIIELIQKVLLRRREKGIITLCVAPSQFSYIQDAREELLTSIDSQAELEIIPDASVQDRGCVIRSSFGSIDARIDTQLKEIKSALQQVAQQSEGA